MRQVNWRDFKEQCEEFLDLVGDEPMVVVKSGKPVAAVVSLRDYELLQRIEDAYWIARAEVADSAGESAEAIRTKQELAPRAAELRASIHAETGNLSDSASLIREERDRRG